MNYPTNRGELTALIDRHRSLDTVIESNRAQFISDWNCDNPFFEELLGPQLFALISGSTASGSYIYFDEEHSILQDICDLHLKREGLQLSRVNVVAGPGSSSFLTAFSLWLHQCGYRDVYYLPPLYHTFHFLLQSLGVNVTPVSTKHAFEVDFSMNLPSHRTVLLMCDPIWYAGKPVPSEQIARIADWQHRTRSLVFIDGSFQFMKWDRTTSENTCILDPDLTFRLVCPAKSLAIPFFRFAYLLHPSETHHDLMFLYESIVGGASASDLAFARRALQILDNETTRWLMADLFREVYSNLLRRDLIRTIIIPECGYFVFAIPSTKLPGQVVMDQTYFELHGYPDYCRVNLLAALRIYKAR